MVKSQQDESTVTNIDFNLSQQAHNADDFSSNQDALTVKPDAIYSLWYQAVQDVS